MSRRQFATPLDLTGADERLRERFWSKVDRRGPDECWPWLGYLKPNGYGQFLVSKGVFATSSRAALAITIGRPLGLGEVACHKCDNPPCVNPVHLFAGTQSDNNLDSYAKGRKTGSLGTRHGSAKLTEDDVREIRSAVYYYGSDSELSRKYGITRANIRKVRLGRTWGHVR